MFKSFTILTCLLMHVVFLCRAQETPSTPKPTDHVIGTVTKVDAASHAVTVKEDRTGAEYSVLLENTKTLLKVPPGAKDLKSATRINAGDLEVGDRVDVRGTKSEDLPAATPPHTIAARSVVLMSGRDLAQTHQSEAAAWQHSTAGMVNSVDPAAHTLAITVRTPDGPRQMTVQASNSTDFTRYSLDNPATPARSQLGEIQPGDQVRVIGDKSQDGATLTAQRVYSGAFRTIAGTVGTISPDGKTVTVKDLQTKQSVEVTLTANSTVRKLPPAMAMGLARRLNPQAAATQGNTGSDAGPRPANRGAGDLSRMLEQVPTIAISDLKPGDAVVISGVAQGADKSHLLASSIIAGVEPIFQSAPPRQGQSLGDWSLDMQAPVQQ